MYVPFQEIMKLERSKNEQCDAFKTAPFRVCQRDSLR